MSTLPKPFITPEQYLEIEAKAERRSEYYNGQMFPMAGNNSDHVIICTNLAAILSTQFLSRPCVVLATEMRIRVSPTGIYTYPDLILVCGERQWLDPLHTTLLNPTVIIEVHSDSTEAYDRGEKMHHYLGLSSLQEYILVPQKPVAIDQYVRQPNGKFELSSFASLDGTLELPSVGCSIPLRDIYAKTELMGE